MNRNPLTFAIPIFLLGIVFVMIALLGAPVLAQNTATVTPVLDSATPTLFVTATPGLPVLLVTPAAGCAAPLSLRIGGQVIVTSGVNIRATPSVSGVLLNYFAEEKLVRLIDGPVCTNGYNWWRIAGIGEPGWVIEGTPNRYLIQQYNDPDTINCFAPATGVAVGGQIRILNNVRVRAEANSTSQVITVTPAERVVTVIDGPVCNDGLIWWRVRTPFETTNTPIEGWVGEGYPGEYWIRALSSEAATLLPCVRPLSWDVGTRAAVSYNDGVPRRLRAAPNPTAPLVLELLDGIAFDVIDGTAVCSGGYNWWNVRIVATGTTGWIAEGAGGRYWVEVIIP